MSEQDDSCSPSLTSRQSLFEARRPVICAPDHMRVFGMNSKSGSNQRKRTPLKSQVFHLHIFLALGLALPVAAFPLPFTDEDPGDPGVTPTMPVDAELAEPECGSLWVVPGVEGPLPRSTSGHADADCWNFAYTGPNHGSWKQDSETTNSTIKARSRMWFTPLEDRNMANVFLNYYARHAVHDDTPTLQHSQMWKSRATYTPGAPPADGHKVRLEWDFHLSANVTIHTRTPDCVDLLGNAGLGHGNAHASVSLSLLDTANTQLCGGDVAWLGHIQGEQDDGNIGGDWYGSVTSSGTYSSQEGSYSAQGSVQVIGVGAGYSWESGGEVQGFYGATSVKNRKMRTLCIGTVDESWAMEFRAEAGTEARSGLYYAAWAEAEARVDKNKIEIVDMGCQDCCGQDGHTIPGIR